jgi:hypothetical protein
MQWICQPSDTFCVKTWNYNCKFHSHRTKNTHFEIKMWEIFNVWQQHLITLQYRSHTMLWGGFKCLPRWRVSISNLKYSVCKIYTHFVFTSNCFYVYFFILQSNYPTYNQWALDIPVICYFLAFSYLSVIQNNFPIQIYHQIYIFTASLQLVVLTCF